MKKQDTSFCSDHLLGDYRPPRLFLHIDLAKCGLTELFLQLQSLNLAFAPA
jgi:hypothetical protein